MRPRHSPPDLRKQSDGLGKVDRHRARDTRERLITNQESDHRQNYGAGEPRAWCWPITAAGPTRLLLAPAAGRSGVPRSDRNKSVAGPETTENMPISMTAHRGYYPD